jgi:hypothetical protein
MDIWTIRAWDTNGKRIIGKFQTWNAASARKIATELQAAGAQRTQILHLPAQR